MAKKHSKTGQDIGVMTKYSIAAAEGKSVNEIEKLLMLTKRLIEREMKNGKSTMTMNKDSEYPVKVKYENALRTCDRLYSYLGIRGTFSRGICKNCKHMDTRASCTGVFGKCDLKKGADLEHIYDTCDKWEKEIK